MLLPSILVTILFINISYCQDGESATELEQCLAKVTKLDFQIGFMRQQTTDAQDSYRFSQNYIKDMQATIDSLDEGLRNDLRPYKRLVHDLSKRIEQEEDIIGKLMIRISELDSFITLEGSESNTGTSDAEMGMLIRKKTMLEEQIRNKEKELRSADTRAITGNHVVKYTPMNMTMSKKYVYEVSAQAIKLAYSHPVQVPDAPGFRLVSEKRARVHSSELNAIINNINVNLDAAMKKLEEVLTRFTYPGSHRRNYIICDPKDIMANPSSTTMNTFLDGCFYCGETGYPDRRVKEHLQSARLFLKDKNVLATDVAKKIASLVSQGRSAMFIFLPFSMCKTGSYTIEDALIRAYGFGLLTNSMHGIEEFYLQGGDRPLVGSLAWKLYYDVWRTSVLGTPVDI